jgi:GTPase
MAFVDEITLHMKAGHGGHGVVRWRHEKGKEFSGAAGGNGGRGGSVFARAVRDFGILAGYRNRGAFEAERGQDGMRNSMHGKDGADVIVDLPIGSVITNVQTKKQYQLLRDGEQIELLTGGRGGLGNEHFKASTNTTPKEFTPGKEGDEADFYIELELVVDAGLIGLPNAGKSSLLNELTNAQAKVGGYQFTTLEPNLGDFYGYILADIPGLIEGASEGRGLGHKFLRHIKRTKLLFHCISLENEDMMATYTVVRSELEKYDPELARKEEIIILTKTDLATPEKIAEAEKMFKKKSPHLFSVTVYDNDSVKRLRDDLVKTLRDKIK